jgi:hypothetical protein
VTGACGGDDDEPRAASSSTVAPSTSDPKANVPLAEAEIIATEAVAGDTTTYGFDVPDDLTANATQFNLSNGGSEPHHAQLFELNPGSTADDLKTKALANDIPGMLGLGTFAGGTGTTSPGKESSSADAIVDLVAGDYVMMCFLADSKGVPHFASGMFQPFSVGVAPENAAAAPDAGTVVKAADFSFDLKALPPQGVLEVKNVSNGQVHELNVFRLADGATQDDLLAYLLPPDPDSEAGSATGSETETETATGPPPFTAVGGIQGLMPGSSQLLRLDLTSGSYVIACFVPDPVDGKPHADKGMVKTLTIA